MSMDDLDDQARSAGTDTRPPVLRLGAQTLDAARGVNRHHELRMAHHYARLAQAVETAPSIAADGSSGATGLPA